MSLIPFILELADELHEFNRCLATGGMDVDDFGFGIYPHELQPQQQQTQTQHPLQQQQPQQQHLSQQRRPRPLSQFYWMPNISKSRHHPYYRGKPCCNKTPIQLVHEHHLEKESSSTAGSGGGVGGTNSTVGTSAGDKESTTNAHSPNTGTHNVPPTTAAGKSAYSVVNKNGFQVSMNVKQFAPNELTVKTIDNCIVVEGQHEDKEDGHGVISRHFIRKYMLPKGYDPNEVLSTLSSDGILTVKAPPPAMKTDETLERIVDIQQTGGPVQVQTTVKEPIHAVSSGKEDQTNVAASGVEQPATPVAVVAGTLPISAIITLQQQQKQSQPMTATVEGVQQQQPAKVTQPTIKDLQETRERNGNIEPNEMLVEQETEPCTAESAATSSNANNISNNNNINNNIEVSNINRSCAKSSAAASKTNLKTEIKEKESLAEDEAKPVGSDNATTNKQPLTTTVATTSAIDAIMTAVTADEPMETEMEAEEEIVKDVGKKPAEDSLLTSGIEDALPIVSDINSVANSSSAPNNDSTSNNFVTNNNSLNIVETNGIEITSANDAVIELASSAIATETNDIVVLTNNGVPEIKTAEGLTISLETATVATVTAAAASAELDEATELEAEVCETADGVDADMDADGLDGGPMSIATDISVGVVDVNVIAGDGNRASVEDGNDESSSVGNLVVAAQSPSAADLVAAADAAILLSKAQCDVSSGTGDVAAGKPAITTEEITN